MTAIGSDVQVAGPWYEELEVGQVFDAAPGITLTAGHAAVHQAVLGDRLRLPLDAHLCAEVTGDGALLAHPGLVCDVAIGQSTLATQRVIANLFYRGLVLRRSVRLGETLRTSTEVVALRDNAPRADRPPTGLAALRVRTVDQLGRPVLDFHRCAMLPMRSEEVRPGHADDLDAISAELTEGELAAVVTGWDLGRYRALVPGAHGADLTPGTSYVMQTGDTVTAAPELVRLTLNVAGAHSDPAASGRGRRLVYGGHTIGIALSHVTRAIPNLVTVAGWRGCDHLAPVHEGDVLRSSVMIASMHDRDSSVLADLRVLTSADRDGGGNPEPVLDWRLVGVMAR